MNENVPIATKYYVGMAVGRFDCVGNGDRRVSYEY